MNEAIIEVPIDRIDLFSTEGISRVIRNYLNKRVLSYIEPKESEIKVYVDHEVSNIRPYISCAIIEDISLNREAIRQFQQFQEIIHRTHCRRKRKASIFVHDLDKITPPIMFTCRKPDEIEFIPFGESKKMKAKQMLTSTHVGKLHAHLFFALEKYPALVDSKRGVLCIPMLVCSEEVKVEEGTRNIFIEVTGMERGLVDDIISVAIANIIDRGGKIKSVSIIHPNIETHTPTLKKRVIKMSLSKVNRLLNANLDTQKITGILRKAGYEVKEEDNLEILIPYYRVDVIHEYDVIEDILLMYGCNNIRSSMLKGNTMAKEDKLTKFVKKIKEFMIGLGFQEILSPTLTDKKILKYFLKLNERDLIEILNVITPRYNILRKRLLPGVLEFLSNNTSKMYPQKIFEIGYVTMFFEESDTKSLSILKIASAISDFKVSYEEIMVPVYLILRKSKVPFKVEATTHEVFIPGRVARIIIGEGRNKQEIGVLGEIHPRILMNFKNLSPVAAFELNLQKLFEYAVKVYGGAAEI